MLELFPTLNWVITMLQLRLSSESTNDWIFGKKYVIDLGFSGFYKAKEKCFSGVLSPGLPPELCPGMAIGLTEPQNIHLILTFLKRVQRLLTFKFLHELFFKTCFEPYACQAKSLSQHTKMPWMIFYHSMLYSHF